MLFTTAFISLLASTTIAAESAKSTQKPCTIHSPTTGSYFDLTQIQLHPSSKTSMKEARTESWHARGYDYGANFTINFCGPVIEDLDDVEGISESRAANVSAYYKKDGKTYSIGQQNSEPVFRGRMLVLNYTDGSPCPDSPSPSLFSRKSRDDDDDDDDDEDDKEDDKKKSKGSTKTPSSSSRRKSTILSFLCDRDPQYTDHPHISFIGSMDLCTYHFQVRSRAACGGATSQSPSSLGPGGVFGVILGIAVCVYLIGGCAYQRTVMHQRGWRQCPNWSVWKGIFDFLGDTFIIITSSISRLLHLPNFSFNRAFNTGGGGYHRVGEDNSSSAGPFGRTGRTTNSNGWTRGRASGGGVGGGRRDQAAEENRLIDQLDEEWDD